MLTQSIDRSSFGKKSEKSANYFPDEVGEPQHAGTHIITLKSEVWYASRQLAQTASIPTYAVALLTVKLSKNVPNGNG
jgi:hypothetical protein